MLGLGNSNHRQELYMALHVPKMLCNAAVLIWCFNSLFTNGFIIPNTNTKINNIYLATARRRQISGLNNINTPRRQQGQPITSNTKLNVFFFGGTPEVEITSSTNDSCELVEVRIEKTSSNSRRIGGEIIVDAPIDDVWAILTDYDNLSTHVPNLVESRRRRSGSKGEQGDGSYTCQLYQKGAQKIIGFEFGASVTMDMVEKTVFGEDTSSRTRALIKDGVILPKERLIEFKCVDSQFFSEFDGEWRAKSTDDGLSTILNYMVDVRPKGPVPVIALEWRIREDVPTNLRAVKKSAIEVGKEGVLKMRRNGNRGQTVRRALARNVKSISNTASVGSVRARELVERVVAGAQQQQPQLTPIRVPVWDDEETMAVYLNNEVSP